MALRRLGSRGSVGILSNIGQSLLQNLSFRCQRVQCLRIGNAEIPNEKRLRYALQHIQGIGRQRAHKILVDLSLENKPAKDLTGFELHSLREEVSKYLIGDDLRRHVKADIERLVGIQCHRGFNHVCMMPCRGQRTKTNARTRKGQRRGNLDGRLSLAESIQRRQERGG